MSLGVIGDLGVDMGLNDQPKRGLWALGSKAWTLARHVGIRLGLPVILKCRNLADIITEISNVS